MARRKIPHFRLYLQDFRDGTGHMSAAEVGDYIRLLIEIYDHDGPLAMNAERLRWALNCRPSMVEKKIARLVELGKLSVDENGCLHNGRADEEMEIRRNWREKYPRNSEKVSEKSAKTSTKSNAPVHSRARHDPVPVLSTDVDNGEGAASPHLARAKIPEPELPFAKPDPPKRAASLPPDFVPDLAYAEGKGLSRQQALREAEQFRNHHEARGTVFKSWPAAWRTWVGNASRFAANRATGPPQPVNELKAAFDDILGRNRHEQPSNRFDAGDDRADRAGAGNPLLGHAISSRR